MQHLKRSSYTSTDLAWVTWSVPELKTHFDQMVASMKSLKQSILDAPPDDFETIAGTLSYLLSVSSEDSVFSFLSNVSTDDDIINYTEQATEKIQNLHDQLASDPELYQALKALQRNHNPGDLTSAQAKLLADLIQSYEQAGLGLPQEKLEELNQLKQKSANISLAFQKHLRNYEDHILIGPDIFAQLPASLQSQLEPVGDQYKVTLAYPIAGPFLRYCPDPTLRQQLADKLSQKGGPENRERMHQLAKLRQEMATILGKESYADHIISAKMAQSEAKVRSFTMDILNRTQPTASLDDADLEAYKQKQTGQPDAKLHYYDSAYYTRLLIEEKFDYDPEVARSYFPIDQVIAGTFAIMENVFGVTFAKQSDWPSWHPDVEYYKVERSGELMGYIALDLYPRPKKYGHVCAYPVKLLHRPIGDTSGQYQAPLTAMLAQFPRPTDDQPSLLSFREVETFLHEFGHLMHSILTEAPYPYYAGTATKSDFVELPSQMFENWASEAESVAKLSRHYQTGDPLPAELLAKIQQLNKFRNASNYRHQALQQLFDLDMHGSQTIGDLTAHWKSLWQTYGPKVDQPPRSLFPAGFGHLANPGYVAGYYGYLWAKVFAVDCFTRFRDSDVLSREVGWSFWEHILATGGSQPESKSLQDFLGREPSLDAFFAEEQI